MPNNEYETPAWVYDPLFVEFNFQLDAAATQSNAKCNNYYTKEQDALEQDWYPHGSIWVNPPYSKSAGPIYKWVQKAKFESSMIATVVMLLTADISTKWFHDFIWDADSIEQGVRLGIELRFLPKRVRHLLDGKVTGSPPWGSMIVIFRV